MVYKALHPALLVFIFIAVFTFIVVYEYEIIRFLYPEFAGVELKVPFASGFSSLEKLILNIIIVAIPSIPAVITFIFEYKRLKTHNR